MFQSGGKNAKKTSSDSKRHFTVVIGNKENGLYISSSPSSAARKAVTKLCASNKRKKVEFYMREITQGSKKKTYGPYEGYIENLKEPIELKGRVIKYKPVAKLSGKTVKKMKGGAPGNEETSYSLNNFDTKFGTNSYVPQSRITSYEETSNGKAKIKSFNRKQNAIHQAKKIQDYKNYKFELKKEKARQKAIETQKSDEISRLYNDLRGKVEDFVTRELKGYIVHNHNPVLVIRDNTHSHIYSDSKHIIYLTIDNQTHEYIAFSIFMRNDEVMAKILFRTNDIDTIYNNLLVKFGSSSRMEKYYRGKENNRKYENQSPDILPIESIYKSPTEYPRVISNQISYLKKPRSNTKLFDPNPSKF